MPETAPHLADDGVTLGSPPAPRTVLFWDGTRWHVPRVDDDGRVQVRGEDQLFSFKGQYRERVESLLVAAADHWLNGAVVPAGEMWVVTNINMYNTDTAITRMRCQSTDGVLAFVLKGLLSPAIREMLSWQGHIYLEEGDSVRGQFVGCALNDNLYFDVHGYKMTVET